MSEPSQDAGSPRPVVRAVRGNVIYADFGRAEEDPVDKQRLATILNRSVRWVELRLAEGMPSTTGRRGKRLFAVSECRRWLEANHASPLPGNGTPPAA